MTAPSNPRPRVTQEDKNAFLDLMDHELYDDPDIGAQFFAHYRERSIAELLSALERLVPTNVCLTNRNIPDSTVVPLEMDVTMGELRALAALIASARGGAA